ncbi:branched-chain amino acid ABC transporter permease [Azospirillum picis]|uniref:Branched-chain amino acid transport system permease protein n=1 Tax=Azospirillum picis TaxID=488438 RepID=A0ABU0MMI3_9PROT|nr:branched-chain amino acid ABC transporter permease [Azospirillum picis]MBP2300678.1 branched-chain amino acid transport system permease protein [Azospirillum picis]MDQ0534647.1 branched-chain amino acid transport system permease protein [Azospirillum picis]
MMDPLASSRHGFIRTVAAASAMLVAACAVSLQLNDYYLYVVTIGAIFAVLAVSFDVLLGYTGYLSLAHGALYGLGAYICAVLTARHGLPFWAALPVAGLATGAAGALVALLSFRTRGLYFAVLTLGIGLVGHQLFLVFDQVTGGVGGFVGIPGPEQPAWLPVSPVAYAALLALALLWVTFVAASLFVRSKLGAACLAVREDITLARALGIRVAAARLSAFAFSATFAGLAGALFAAISSFIAPESFTVLGTGFQLVALVVVGGMGTLWGPVVGAILLTALPEALRVASTYSLLAYGVLLLVCVIFAPKGIASLISAAVRRFRGKSKPAPDPARLRREATP